MSLGDRVRHKLEGSTMTITKISETIAVCRRDEPIRGKWLGMETEHWTAICKLENLELITEKQMKLF